MIDQQETILSKSDHALNKSKFMLFHSNQPSEEVINNLQEKLLDQNQLNDDHCFKCNKKGELYCCDRCFRAFHKACISTKRFSKFWNCEYCTQHNVCVQCQLSRSQSQPQQNQLICTICFRFVHKMCCQVPLQILNSNNHFFLGSENFVCKACIKNFGYKFVLTLEKSQTNPDKVYYFVNVDTRSPIHCGWFSESILRQVAWKEEEKLKEVQVFQVPKIDKILRVKVPIQRKHQDSEQILNQLILRTNTSQISQSRYGDCNNFYFLVVWEGSDFTGATWEDQKVLHIAGKQSSELQLLKFLLYKKLQLTLKEEKPLHQIELLFNKYLPITPRPNQFRFSNLLYNFQQINSNLNYIISGSNYNQTIDFIGYYIQELFSKDLIQPPILLVCGGAIGRWQRRINELCLQLNMVTLKGTELQVSELKKKQIMFQLLNQLRCHLIILPIQRWSKQKKYLSGKIAKFSHIIFDQQVPQNILQEIQLQKISDSKKTYIVHEFKNCNRHFLRNKKKIYKEIDVQLQIVIYDLTTNKILNTDQSPYKKSINASQELKEVLIESWHHFESQSVWKQLERNVFLQFVLAFGFNYVSGEMFERLKLFSKGTFKGDQNDRKQFQRYSKRFLAVLYKIPSPETSENLSYYFFDLKPEFIYKRVVRLYRLKANVDICKISPQKFKQAGDFIIFQGIKSHFIKQWEPKYDYLLSTLILEKGYGKWIEIAQSKDWVKWASSCHFSEKNQPKRLALCTFKDYVKKILFWGEYQQSGFTLRKLQQILRQRGETILFAQDNQ